MTVFNTTIKFTAVGAAMLLVSGLAGAQGLADNGTWPLGGNTAYTSGGAAGSITPNGTYSSGWVGARSFTYTPSVGSSSTFWAYCIDPKTGGVPNGTTNYSSTSLDSFLTGGSSSGYATQVTGTGYSGMSTTAATQQNVLNKLTDLYSHAYLDAIGTAVPQGALGQSTYSAKAAAFGMVVWEIIMQDQVSGNYSASTGRMRSNGSSNSNSDDIQTWTNAYLTALNTGNWGNVNNSVDLTTVTAFQYTIWSDTPAPGRQNFLQVTLPGTGLSVPEPGTIALVGLALIGATRLSRRRAISA